MKKILLAVNLVLLVALAVFFIRKDEVNQHLFPQSSHKAISKIEKNFINTDEDILAGGLCYNGEVLAYDAASGTFYLPLSMDEEAWEDGELTSGTKGVSITFLSDVEAASKSEYMAAGTPIPFYAFDSTQYRQYYVVITGLPVISINTLSESSVSDLEQITDEAAYEQTVASNLYSMRVYAADTKDSSWITDSDFQMHVRGNTSRIYPKKGFRVSLLKQDKDGEYVANKVSLLDMREDDDWVLYAMYNEGTKIRDKLSIDVWNAYGASDNDFKGTLGTNLTYVEVVWDGEYYGMYGLMEPVDEKQVNLTSEDGIHQTEYLYKKKQPSNLDVSHLRSDTGEAMKEGIELKSSQSSDMDAWNTLADFIDWQQNSTDEDFISQADQMVDMSNAMDMWLFTNIITGYDQLGKNMYFIAKADNGSYRFYFAPWDMDLTWGYTSDAQMNLGCKFEADIYDAYVWWEPGNRLITLDAADARDIASEKYQNLRSNTLTDEWFEEEVDSLQHIVLDSGAFARDQARWPDGNHDGDYESLRTYIANHMVWMDTFMNDIEEGLEKYGRH